jgi:hypothetical protein
VGSLHQWIDAAGIVGNFAWPAYLFFLGRRDTRHHENAERVERLEKGQSYVEGLLKGAGIWK